MKQKEIKSVIDFIYEAANLAKTPRSGLWLLGTGHQSVAEHLCHAAFIGYALAMLTPKADERKVVLLCLMHDLGEARTSDLNYVHQRYGRLAEDHAVEDLSKTVPFGPKLKLLYKEAKERETLEAKLAKDADNLQWIATLREEETKGNVKAKQWIRPVLKRLKTPIGKKLGALLAKTHPDRWWFSVSDKWFEERKEKYRQWKK